jgi:hypothetical protein
MRKDLTKPDIRSSFLSCEKDTETILRRLFIESKPYSDVLKKLLVINTKDCLTATGEKEAAMKKYIDSKNLKTLLDEQYIRLEPKITFGEHEEVKSYILISFDNFVPNKTNPEFRDCTITFNIICHTDQWDIDNYETRPLKIAGYIDGILNGAKLSGIGELHFLGCNQLILSEDISGYILMFQAIHSVEGDDKIPPVEE